MINDGNQNLPLNTENWLSASDQFSVCKLKRCIIGKVISVTFKKKDGGVGSDRKIVKIYVLEFFQRNFVSEDLKKFSSNSVLDQDNILWRGTITFYATFTIVLSSFTARCSFIMAVGTFIRHFTMYIRNVPTSMAFPSNAHKTRSVKLELLMIVHISSEISSVPKVSFGGSVAVKLFYQTFVSRPSCI